jgi:26S proteasome regulatory subunit N1
LTPKLKDSRSGLDVVAFTAISLGLIYVGTCKIEIAKAISFSLMSMTEFELEEPLIRLLPLGIGLLYLGKQVTTTP